MTIFVRTAFASVDEPLPGWAEEDRRISLQGRAWHMSGRPPVLSGLAHKVQMGDVSTASSSAASSSASSTAGMYLSARSDCGCGKGLLY
jgi:hypothetical protein